MLNDTVRSKLSALSRRLEEIDRMLAAPETAADMNKFRDLSRERTEIEPVAVKLAQYESAEADLKTAEELAEDPEMREFAEEETAKAKAELERLEEALRLELIPKDPNDERNIFLEVRAGTGGDEAALFAGDILRMYLRYAESQGWKTEIVSRNESELGGYKEAIVRIIGRGAYSKLKFESGGHRVQRVPVTETQGRIHTSACTVAVLPELDEIEEVKLDPSELRIDVFRASGAGGQHIQKTESAVRIHHIPTGIITICQDDRSQHRNREKAMQQLKAKLYELEMRKRMEAQTKLEEQKSDIGWGHQIRSYVLDQSRVKDLRTGVETGNTGAVLDGDLDQFIEASLKNGVGGLPAAE